jgi:hypothetical protein
MTLFADVAGTAGFKSLLMGAVVLGAAAGAAAVQAVNAIIQTPATIIKNIFVFIFSPFLMFDRVYLFDV